MPQHVWRNPASQAGVLGEPAQLEADRLGSHLGAITIDEKRPRADLRFSAMGNKTVQILSQSRVGDIGDAIPRAFALDAHGRAIRRQIVQLELAQFADPYSG